MLVAWAALHVWAQEVRCLLLGLCVRVGLLVNAGATGNLEASVLGASGASACPFVWWRWSGACRWFHVCLPLSQCRMGL